MLVFLNSFIHFPYLDHLDCFQSLVILNKAALNILIRTGVGVGLWIEICLTLVGSIKQLSKVSVSVCTPPARLESFICFMSLPTLYIPVFLILDSLWAYSVIL